MAEVLPGVSATDVRTWQSGWGRARTFPPATDLDGVLRVDIGQPGRVVELVVLDADSDPRRVDRAAQLALGARDPWVTVPTLDTGRTADRLHEHGLRTPPLPEWLMTVALRDQARVALPEGFSSSAELDDTAVRLTLTAPGGEVAASGQLAVVGDCGVPDKIEVRAAYRRRGLGSAMMTLLADHAVDLGAVRGLLMASTEGRALYSSLGWTTLCPVVIARLWD